MFEDQPGGYMDTKIQIGNITDKVARHDIESRFSKYGKIIGIQMFGTSAQVVYDRHEYAQQAIRHEHMTQLRDCRLDVTIIPEKMNNRPGMPHGRSPTNERFRDNRGLPGGRGDRFRDETLPVLGFEDNFRNMGGSLRGGDGEPFNKHGRFDGGREPMPMGGPNTFPEFYKDDFMGPEKVNDCEIIVLNKLQQGYAELIEQRLKNIGLTVDLMFVRDDAAILRAVNDIAKKGSFYSAIISNQNEVHGSLTLNVLQGPAPQEHRNMPLDDALKLIARTFVQMRQEKRNLSNGQTPIDREIHFILNLLMNGKYLTIPELDRVLRYVQDIRDRQSIAEKNPIGPLLTTDNRSAGVDSNSPVKQSDSLIEQQNLQQRILSIISQGNPPGDTSQSASVDTSVGNTMGNNQGNLMAKNSNASGHISGSAMPTQAISAQPNVAAANTYINFDNPSVQKALDSLMSSGPNLLKSISLANHPNMPGHSNSGQNANVQNVGMPGGPMNMFPQPNQGQHGNNQGGYRHPLMGNQVPFFNPRGNAGGGGVRY